MLAYVSVCDRNIRDAASTDMIDTSSSEMIRAIPRSPEGFIHSTPHLRHKSHDACGRGLHPVGVTDARKCPRVKDVPRRDVEQRLGLCLEFPRQRILLLGL